MTTLALIAGYEKMRNNEKVCKFCEITKCLAFMTFPLALPFLIILMSVSTH